MKRLIKNEEGAVIVLLSLVMTGFLALIALVLDGGNLYLEKNRLQKMVDAAALAGGQDLPLFPIKAEEAAKLAARKNFNDNTDISVEILKESRLIKVTGTKQVNLVFGNALGIKDPVIKASATVELFPLTSAKGAIPLGVEYTADMSKGTEHKLKVADATVGNFGALAIRGPGAKIYGTDLKYGYEFTLKVGDILDTETGNMAGATKDAINYRVSLCPDSTETNFTSNCSRVVLVPVFKTLSSAQNQVKQIQIIGFASFFLKGVTSSGNGTETEVVGYFIETTLNGEIDENQTNYGSYGIKLTQ